MNYTDVITSIGVSFILLAFGLVTFKRIASDSAWYFVLNLVGGGFAFWGSLLLASVPFATLEGIWTVVAAVGLVGVIRKKGPDVG